eukprot:TRINITY_DN8066_c0_g1_i1.p1 TRINITY_DN8066_c0_g1~~TRINITY_DN8066_c0_g1_i1.p1  ORF type:complete len:355 (+),score=125.16 TRINITY_DN8066_c0_g1_i1:101-1165(+)
MVPTVDTPQAEEEVAAPSSSSCHRRRAARQMVALVAALVLLAVVYMVAVSIPPLDNSAAFAVASSLDCHPELHAHRREKTALRDCDTLHNEVEKTDILLGAGKLKRVYVGCMWGEQVAVEEPQPDRVGDPDFASGAKRMETLQDIEGVVPLYGYCEDEGRELIVTKYLSNGPVAYRKWPRSLGFVDWRRTQQLPLDTRVDIAYDIAKIVHDVHHRPEGTRILCDWGVDQFSMDSHYRVYFTDLDHMPMLGEDGLVECSPKRFVDHFGLHPTYAPEQATGYMGITYDSFKMAAMFFEPLFSYRPDHNPLYAEIDELVQWCTQKEPQDRPLPLDIMKALASIKTRLFRVVDTSVEG